MKRVSIVFILLMASITCRTTEHKDPMLPWFLTVFPNSVVLHSCMKYSGKLNYLYFTYQYADRFMDDRKQYRVVVRGNSTVDSSRLIPGWKSDDTQVVAVAGNDLCDMIVQVPAINTKNPEAIVISTPGGNDALRGTDVDYILESFRSLLLQTRVNWPSAKIVVIGIHPVRVSGANEKRAEINRKAKEILSLIPGSCWVDPNPVFGKGEADSADKSQMMDDIHYAPHMALKLKEALSATCGVRL